MIQTMDEAANVGPPQDDRERIEPFLGTWALVSFEHVLPSGEVTRPFGDSPSGSILYQPSGHMSAQVSVGSPTRFANDDPDRASAEEATEAWRMYLGYWGFFKVFAEEQVVVHRVEGSSFSNWIGTEQARHFRFDGANRLVLEAQFSSGRSTLVWQKRSD
jgi:lipocalin-like protein